MCAARHRWLARRWTGALAGEVGAGSTLALGIIGATAAIAIALIGVVGVFAAHTAASVAADAAALAAADTASNRIPGDACGRAKVVASLHQASLQACTATRIESVVTVSRDLGWFTITASARAGLPR
ncbi:helicase [Gulosibacter chungangensis]|uniref:Helicase n=1 Tax=Gulosibacter chungangensis TaxID=979746 RepID=A0A7J5BEZ3_9MICO|nr:helicase [Gulosibacter chungangensis]KAB1644826.1 helicase [Gulosibacter chungangensis]